MQVQSADAGPEFLLRYEIEIHRSNPPNLYKITESKSTTRGKKTEAKIYMKQHQQGDKHATRRKLLVSYQNHLF